MKEILRNLVLMILLPALGFASAGSEPCPETDAGQIDAVIKSLYESITFPEGGSPDLERFRSLFTPEAQFIRINKDDSIDRFSRDAFIQSFRERIEKGLIKSFHESEISPRTEVFGRMAQVFSVYRKGINISELEKMAKGVNGIQLYEEAGGWRICSIVWMDERENCPLPDKYLKSQ
jgi:hypothetical protein